jgi:hypothetical protein
MFTFFVWFTPPPLNYYLGLFLVMWKKTPENGEIRSRWRDSVPVLYGILILIHILIQYRVVIWWLAVQHQLPTNEIGVWCVCVCTHPIPHQTPPPLTPPHVISWELVLNGHLYLGGGDGYTHHTSFFILPPPQQHLRIQHKLPGTVSGSKLEKRYSLLVRANIFYCCIDNYLVPYQDPN